MGSADNVASIMRDFSEFYIRLGAKLQETEIIISFTPWSGQELKVICKENLLVLFSKSG